MAGKGAMTQDLKPASDSDPRRSSFPTTHWSMVVRATAHTDTQAHAALASLCQRYWYPLYAYARRSGRDHHDAEDATQQFLAQLLAADGLRRARPDRGRFRTFLLTSLNNFLTSEWRRVQAAKRGGGIADIPLGTSAGDELFAREAAHPGLTPEQAFDRTWALGMIDRAVADLAAEYRRDGRGAVCEALAPLMWGDASAEKIAQQAAKLNMTVPTFTVALHRSRRRLGDRLRALVAETVADPADIDAELRHLVAALSSDVAHR
jgi:DNA-directed RNA polymerase specialized sigma24 family protein